MAGFNKALHKAGMANKRKAQTQALNLAEAVEDEQDTFDQDLHKALIAKDNKFASYAASIPAKQLTQALEAAIDIYSTEQEYRQTQLAEAAKLKIDTKHLLGKKFKLPSTEEVQEMNSSEKRDLLCKIAKDLHRVMRSAEEAESLIHVASGYADEAEYREEVYTRSAKKKEPERGESRITAKTLEDAKEVYRRMQQAEGEE